MNLQPCLENVRPAIRNEPVSVAFIGSARTLPMVDILNEWSEFLRAHHPRHELLILDDAHTWGDTDFDTIPSTRLLRHPRPLGIGGELQTAILAAQHPLLLAVRADRRFDPRQAYRLFNSIDQGDLIVGHRVFGRIPLPVRAIDEVRSWTSRIFLGNFLEPRTGWPGWSAWRRMKTHRWVFGIPVADTESGLFLARRSIFDRIPIQSRSLFAFVEVLAKANHTGFMLGEERVAWTPNNPESAAFSPGEASGLFRRPQFRSVKAPDLPISQVATAQ